MNSSQSSNLESDALAKDIILLVEDDTVMQEVTLQMLESFNFEVLVASSGYEAMDIYKEKFIDIYLVLMDMVMPGMNGSQTYDEMKKINPDVRMVLMSGFTPDEEMQKLIDGGVTDFLKKPFTLEILSSMLFKAIS